MTHPGVGKSQIVLASSSAIRQALLRNAGVQVLVKPPGLDERDILARAGVQTARQASALLAKRKALAITWGPQDLVIGCDQVLEFEGRVLSKVQSMEEAAQRLHAMAGKTHYLTGACVLAQDGRIVWQHQNRAAMQMRPLDREAIATYLQQAGPQILSSVGCYQIEALGIHLMERMQGSYFSILGLPLLPLLNALRQQGAIW